MNNSLEPFAQLAAQHLAAPPPIQAANRLGLGVFLLTGCGYVAAHSPMFLGDDISRLIAVAVHAPSQASIGLMIWVGCVGLGLLWFIAGIRGPHGPGSTLAAFWAAVRIALILCALSLGWYLPGAWGYWTGYVNLVLRGLYFVFLATSAVELVLALRRPPGDARKIVTQQIEQQQVTMRPVKRR